MVDTVLPKNNDNLWGLSDPLGVSTDPRIRDDMHFGISECISRNQVGVVGIFTQLGRNH